MRRTTLQPTVDPNTGRKGPCIVARAATHDAELNLRSLDAIERTGAQLLYPKERPTTITASR
jgi:hypothetical protein